MNFTAHGYCMECIVVCNANWGFRGSDSNLLVILVTFLLDKKLRTVSSEEINLLPLGRCIVKLIEEWLFEMALNRNRGSCCLHRRGLPRCWNWRMRATAFLAGRSTRRRWRLTIVHWRLPMSRLKTTLPCCIATRLPATWCSRGELQVLLWTLHYHLTPSSHPNNDKCRSYIITSVEHNGQFGWTLHCAVSPAWGHCSGASQDATMEAWTWSMNCCDIPFIAFMATGTRRLSTSAHQR